MNVRNQNSIGNDGKGDGCMGWWHNKRIGMVVLILLTQKEIIETTGAVAANFGGIFTA